MIDDSKTRPGLDPARPRRAYQTTADILIPAGTLLREGKVRGLYSCPIGMGKSTSSAVFSVSVDPASPPHASIMRPVEA